MSASRWKDSLEAALQDRRVTAFLSCFAVLVVVFLVGWLQKPATSEPQKPIPPDPFQDPKAGAAHVRRLAKEYGSDFDRLSNDDRLFLNAIAMGHGRELLAKTARELDAKPAVSPK